MCRPRVKLFHDWPTPIVVSGFEVGMALPFPAASIEHDFAYVPDHPVAEAYRSYMKMPYDRPTWDLTAVLYAVRPDEEIFLALAARNDHRPAGRQFALRAVCNWKPPISDSHR